MNVAELGLGQPELSSPPPWLRDSNDAKNTTTHPLRPPPSLQQDTALTSAFHPVTSSNKHSNYVTLQPPLAAAAEATHNVGFVGFRNPPAVRLNVAAISKTSSVTQIAKVYPNAAQASVTSSETEGVSFLDSLVTSHDADFQIISKIQDVKKRFVQSAMTSSATDVTDPKLLPTSSSLSVATSASSVTSQPCKPTPIKLELPTTGSYRAQFKMSPTLSSATLSQSPGSTAIDVKKNTAKPASAPAAAARRLSPRSKQGALAHRQTNGDVISEFLNYDSDESSTSRALSNKFSLASTVSLSELLDRNKTGSDDTSSVDTFRMFESDYECGDDVTAPAEGDYDVLMQCDVNDYMGSGREPIASMTSAARQVNPVPTQAPAPHHTQKSDQDFGDYVCLRKIREYIYVNMPDVTPPSQTTRDNISSTDVAPPCDCAACVKNLQHAPAPAYVTSRPYINRPQQLPLPSNTQQPPHNAVTSSHSSRRSLMTSSSSSKSGSRISTPSTLITKGEGESRRGSRDSVFEGQGRRRQSRSHSQSDEQFHDYVNITPDMLARGRALGAQMTYVNVSPEKKQQVIAATSAKPSKLTMTSQVVTHAAVHVHAPPATRPKPSARCGDVTSPSRTERSSSPDSAVMQRSCSSSENGVRSAGSDDVTSASASGARTLDRLRSARDEGYSSNSSNSIKLDAGDRLHNGYRHSVTNIRQVPSHVRAQSGSSDQLRRLQPLQERAPRTATRRGTTVTLRFCSKAHQLKRSHSTSCCCSISSAIAQIQSCMLKTSHSVVDLRRSVMCVKATHYVRQMGIIAQQISSDRKLRAATPQHAPASVDDVSASPIYENLQYYKDMLSATSRGGSRISTPSRLVTRGDSDSILARPADVTSATKTSHDLRARSANQMSASRESVDERKVEGSDVQPASRLTVRNRECC